MTKSHITGVVAKPKNGNRILALPGWGVKAALRLSTIKKPGIYALALVVGADGSRLLVVNNGKPEKLGRGDNSTYQCVPAER